MKNKQHPLSLYAENLLAENVSLSNSGKKEKSSVGVPATPDQEAFKLSVEDAQALVNLRDKLSVPARIALEEQNYLDQIALANAFAEHWK